MSNPNDNPWNNPNNISRFKGRDPRPMNLRPESTPLTLPTPTLTANITPTASAWQKPLVKQYPDKVVPRTAQSVMTPTDSVTQPIQTNKSNPELIAGGLAKLKITGGEAVSRPLKLKNRRWPTESTPISVRANHFEVSINKETFPKNIYHYDVVINNEERSGGGARAASTAGGSENTLPDRILPLIWNHFETQFATTLNSATPFDGKKNAYAPKRLSFEGQDSFSTIMLMKDPDDLDKDRKFHIAMKLVSIVSTEAFWEFLRSETSGLRVELPQDVIQALDVALRYSPGRHFTSCNRSFFSLEGKPVELNNILQLVHGHYQSLFLGCNSRPTLNIDLACKAFYTALPLNVFLCRVLELHDNDDMSVSEWREQDFQNANDALKGKLIEYGTGKCVSGKYEMYHKFTAVGVKKDSAMSYKFYLKKDDPKSKINIVDYMKKIKKTEIKYPNYPVIHIGSQKMTNYVPLELCQIIPQAYRGKMEANLTKEMIKGAAIGPVDRFRRIQASRNGCRFQMCKVLSQFGIQVGKDMTTIPDARRIFVPKIKTKVGKVGDDKTSVNPMEGKWGFKDRNGPHRQFLVPANVPKFGVIDCASLDISQIRGFLDQLAKEGEAHGMTNFLENRKNVIIEKVQQGFDGFPDKIHHKLSLMKKNKVELVIVIMSSDGKEYATIKAEAEVQVGILTACIKQGNVRVVKPQTLTNYLLKLNAKLNGTNWEVDTLVKNFLEIPTLIIGADVTHPSPNSKAPSIAAITASFNLTGMGYNMHIQPQASRQEVIDRYGETVEIFIKDFAKRTGRVPERIVVFRDGVSEGYFNEIKQREFEEIRKVCERFHTVKPIKITFVVVKKRHHTRLQPINEKESVGKFRNVPPGTVVDTVIVHPSEQEFFLNSHVGIQGTSKPTRYHVIHDDNNFTMGDIVKLTYYLCYAFVRCTQPVSYPSATYYAHLAAYRARHLIEKEGENADLKTLTKQLTIHSDLLDKYPMFFV